MTKKIETTATQIAEQDELRFGPVLPTDERGIATFSSRALGQSLAEGVKKAAATMGTQGRYLLTALIVAVCAMIGRRAIIRVGPGHEEKFSIMGIVLGPSGSGKSLSFAHILQTVMALENEENFGSENYNDPGVIAVMDARLKRYQRACVEADETGNPPPDLSPELHRYGCDLGDYALIATDLTAPGVLKSCVASKYGVLVMSEEAAELLTGPRSVQFRDLLLRGYDQSPVRKRLAKMLLSGHTSLSMLGATVPERALRMGFDEGGGLTGRVLVCSGADDEADITEPTELDLDAPGRIMDLISIARNMPLSEEIVLDAAARDRIWEAVGKIRAERRAPSPGLAAALQRATANIVRIAGVLTVIYRADELRRYPGHMETEQTLKISCNAARAAIHLYTELYLPSLELLIAGKSPGMLAIAEVRFAESVIDHHGTDRVAIRDLVRSPTNYGLQPSEVPTIAHKLCASGMATEEYISSGRGRPSRMLVLTPAYLAAYHRRREQLASKQPRGSLAA